MKRFLFVFSVIAVLAINKKSFSQYFKFANTISGLSTQYGIRGLNVFKLDAAGSSVWVKDFTGFIEPSTYPNELIGSAFDGKNLYVLELQGRDYSAMSHTYNPAVIKMDTLGNVESIIKSVVQPGNLFDLIDIYPAFTNGVWFLDAYAPGFTHYGGAVHVDSTLQVDVNIGFWYGSVTTMLSLSELPDSNYLVCVNERPSSTSGLVFPALTKFQNDGTILWQYDYTVFSGSLFSTLVAQAMTTDSFGNSYLLCDYNDNISSVSVRAIAGIKIDPNGNVLVAKAWTALQGSYVDSLRYSNGQLICTISGSDLYFDTLFNNSCLNSQNLILSSDNHYFPSSHISSYVSTSFTPINGSSIFYLPTLSVDFCNILFASNYEGNETKQFTIFPNPAKDYLTWKLESNTNSVQIQIVNVLGKIVKNNCSELNFGTLDISDLSSGLYYVKVRSEQGEFVEKLIK